MPPKKDSKKTADKQKQKIIEDKTFGLKNKNKSTKVQKYVDAVEKQVKDRGVDKKQQYLIDQKKKDKEAAEAAKAEAALLFKHTVIQPKVPPGVDPKSIVCEYFRKGICEKGHKCKFSHDLNVERKAAKIDMYTDRRAEKEADTMDKWDQDKLSSVVEQKQTSTNKNLKTSIICKFFLDAIEAKKYGWFWECPNGGEKCQYVHALPPGFVLKSKKKADEEGLEVIPLEEIIEEERKQLTTRTPVTLETFLVWKEQKRKRKEEEAKAAEDKRQADIKAGRTVMSGREMFVFNPDLFVDDEAATDFDISELGPDDEDDGEQEGESSSTYDDYGGSSSSSSSTTTTTTSELEGQINTSLFIADDTLEDTE
eukprot:TRINITY_DN1475_c0_g1_i4.p1 TRINITY_DN1475_c0_g1~~TRINITY_DN1475_c0_g1_i4.p1  ORF type:complete len:367 (+),score=145.66 TRINITY_DN1475_c0_g1_i4:47-1147(+)